MQPSMSLKYEPSSEPGTYDDDRRGADDYRGAYHDDAVLFDYRGTYDDDASSFPNPRRQHFRGNPTPKGINPTTETRNPNPFTD